VNSVAVFCLMFAVVLFIGVLADKFVAPWRARRLMERIRRDIREGRYVGPVHPITIFWTADGFTLKGMNADRPDEALLWEEVTSVTAYKRDFFSYDQICLFFDRSGNMGIEVTEETNRWHPFIESLHTHLPGCKPSENWYTSVMQPAFAENLTEVFVRNTTKPEKEARA